MLYDNDISVIYDSINDTMLTVLLDSCANSTVRQSNAKNDVTNPYHSTSNNFIEQQ